MNFYPTDTLEKLEFDKILVLLKEKCISELGILQIEKEKFSSNFEYTEKRLQQVNEMLSIIQHGQRFPAQNYFNLENEVKQLRIENNVLEGAQFIKILNVLTTVEEILTFFKKHPDEYFQLKDIIQPIELNSKLIETINNVIDEKGIVRSSASPELLRIRRQVNSKNIELNKVFGKLVQQLKTKGILSDSTESIRNQRRVLSVQAENKRSIGGIIHDESDSGKTSYIEPQETVFLNNELFELERAEKREIYKILQDLTAQIAFEKDSLAQFSYTLGFFDAIRAKALLATEMEAVKPILQKKNMLEIDEAYHPLLVLLNKKHKKETIPLSVKLNEQQHVLLISGPNAGGKSVALKTIGLLQTMVQFGLLIPCDENSKIGLFQQIFTDLGDNQSIENELSTYSAHLNRMNYFVNNSTKNTLFLIDEFGTGTDPRFGAAMAEAILKKMLKTKSFGVITTHYSNLKKFGEQHQQILNGAMLFNENNFSPTYKLQTGKPGSSYTFAIAEKIGMDTALINEAKELVDYSDLKFDELIEKVEQERKQLEKENIAIRTENNTLKKLSYKFEQLNKDLNQQRQNLKAQQLQLEQTVNEQVEREVNAVINRINKSKSKQKAALEVQKITSMKKEFIKDKLKKTPITASMQNFEKNDRILHLSTKNEGEVIEVRGKKVVANFNGLKLTLNQNEIQKIEQVEAKSTSSRPIVKKQYTVENVFDIRGLMEQEAYVQLEQYIDQALLNNLPDIKIIHGRGTGVLRKTVQRVVREYKTNISEWQYEDEKKGGNGATIIRFK